MKYTEPKMNITLFAKENIVTESAGTAVADLEAFKADNGYSKITVDLDTITFTL